MDTIRKHPSAFLPIFTEETKTKLTSGDLQSMFTPALSEQGTNKRRKEEDIVISWIDFLEECEGILI